MENNKDVCNGTSEYSGAIAKYNQIRKKANSIDDKDNRIGFVCASLKEFNYNELFAIAMYITYHK